MFKSSPWRFVMVSATSVAITAFSLLVVSRPREFEKLFLRTAGGVIGGFSDRLGVWIAVSVAMVVIGWLGLGIACWIQSRRAT